MTSGVLLHVGCGGTPKPESFAGLSEVRLDISPEFNPDIVANMTDMGDIGPFDVVYSSHSLEHLFPHEVPRAVGEFHRVLKDGGVAVVVVPDLEDVKPTEDLLFVSDAGPVCGLDLYYGHGRMIHDHPHMAHHCGFVADTLESVLQAAGFSRIDIRRLDCHNLFALARK
jgi:SAM-dependent methyltransferase